MLRGQTLARKQYEQCAAGHADVFQYRHSGGICPDEYKVRRPYASTGVGWMDGGCGQGIGHTGPCFARLFAERTMAGLSCQAHAICQASRVQRVVLEQGQAL